MHVCIISKNAFILYGLWFLKNWLNITTLVTIGVQFSWILVCFVSLPNLFWINLANNACLHEWCCLWSVRLHYLFKSFSQIIHDKWRCVQIRFHMLQRKVLFFLTSQFISKTWELVLWLCALSFFLLLNLPSHIQHDVFFKMLF